MLGMGPRPRPISNRSGRVHCHVVGVSVSRHPSQVSPPEITHVDFIVAPSENIAHTVLSSDTRRRSTMFPTRWRCRHPSCRQVVEWLSGL